MSEDVVRISKLENGWEVECYHKPPATKGKTGYDIPYKSPWKSYGFDSEKKVLAFLKDKLPELGRRMSADEEYDSGFKEAVKASK